MAYCDVDDVGFSACLARFSSAVVRHPEPARQVVNVTLRSGAGTSRTITVLLNGAQTAADAATMALQGTSDETVVATN
ncbi:hypothetical protein [Pinirhizobacter sp.]|jgi:hypothetical protein|uniref:hypothetical protein n=1 Tax=Pinirhizobacter sp. TaxID=2950432 RepID=UPI002F41BBD9